MAQAVRQWKHLSALTQAHQEQTPLQSVVDRARRQIGLFLGILLTVSAVVSALIIYTMTIEKLKQIATLKQIGAPDRTIIGLIVQQCPARPSGTGKTTLLNIICCIIDANGGKLWLDDQLVYDNRWLRVDLRRLRPDKIGFIFQFYNLLPFLDAKDKVALLLQLAGKSATEARAAVGNAVPFVLWFNVLAGYAYVTAGIGLALHRHWALWLSLVILIATTLVFAAFWIHVLRCQSSSKRPCAAPRWQAVQLAIEPALSFICGDTSPLCFRINHGNSEIRKGVVSGATPRKMPEDRPAASAAFATR